MIEDNESSLNLLKFQLWYRLKTVNRFFFEIKQNVIVGFQVGVPITEIHSHTFICITDSM